MTLRSDYKALLFIGSIAVLGTGVRALRAADRSVPKSQPALDRQTHAADSAARAAPDRASRRGRGGGRGGQDTVGALRRARGGRRGRSASSDSLANARGGRVPAASRITTDRAGYIGGRLDLDAATAAQIDSLPGVTPLMAKRIVMDRMRRGPFVNIGGLRRVTGAGPRFLEQIDSLVAFSGTIRWPEPGDTIVPQRRRRRPP